GSPVSLELPRRAARLAEELCRPVPALSAYRRPTHLHPLHPALTYPCPPCPPCPHSTTFPFGNRTALHAQPCRLQSYRPAMPLWWTTLIDRDCLGAPPR